MFLLQQLTMRALGLASIAFVLLASFASTASAESIELEVRTIYAHQTTTPAVDDKLEAIGDELASSFPGYNTFVLIDTSSHELSEGTKKTITLPDADASALEVQFQGWSVSDDSEQPAVKLARLAMGLAGKIGAEVKASPGSVFYQAGLLYKDGILVLAFRIERSGD